MVIKSYHIILAVKILGWFLLKWAGFGELLGWKSSTRSGNTGHNGVFCGTNTILNAAFDGVLYVNAIYL